MRDVQRVVWIVLAGVGMVPGFLGALWNGATLLEPVSIAAAQTTVPPSPPVYHPPSRGVPTGRMGGGTRGSGEGLTLAVLTPLPDHVGLTAQAQPSLYWYISQETTYPVEFTMIDERGIQPLVETRLASPAPGIQRLRLADYGVQLTPGMQYRWFISLVLDPDSRSKDRVAEGFIARAELSEVVQSQLRQAGATHAPRLYAEAGFWYDALAAFSDLIEATPEESLWRQHRATLLEQVELHEVAKYDRGQTQ